MITQELYEELFFVIYPLDPEVVDDLLYQGGGILEDIPVKLYSALEGVFGKDTFAEAMDAVDRSEVERFERLSDAFSRIDGVDLVEKGAVEVFIGEGF